MDKEELLLVLTNHLEEKLKYNNFNFKFSVKTIKREDCVTSEFFQQDRSAPFLCLMKTTYESIQVFFLPLSDYEALCEIWAHQSMHNPKITVTEFDNGQFKLLLPNGIEPKTPRLIIKDIEEVVNVIYENFINYFKDI